MKIFEFLDRFFEYYNKSGLSILMSLLFLVLIVMGISALVKYVSSKTKEESMVDKSLRGLSTAMNSVRDAVDASNSTNKNIDATLKLLTKSVDANTKLIDIIHQENGDIQGRLQLHDDRSEKILTYGILTNQMISQLAKELDKPISSLTKKDLKEFAESKARELSK